jgi:hypothetical protein
MKEHGDYMLLTNLSKDGAHAIQSFMAEIRFLSPTDKEAADAWNIYMNKLMESFNPQSPIKFPLDPSPPMLPPDGR